MSLNSELQKIGQTGFDFILANGKRSSVLLGFDFQSLIHNSFKFVKLDLPDLIKNCNFEELAMSALKDRNVNVFHYEIDRITVNDFMQFLCWIKDELDDISKLEFNYLNAEPDIDLILAGVEKLRQFGDMNVIDNLANGDVLKHEALWKLSYATIFDKQYKAVVENKIQESLRAIKKEKDKGKKP
jgi:hypothetical protein